MNYFKNLIDIQNLADQRLKQFEREEILDRTIEKNYQTCPDQIFRYLMKLREINRKNCIDIYSSNFFEYPTKAKENLKKIEQTFPLLDKKGYYFCQEIDELTKKL